MGRRRALLSSALVLATSLLSASAKATPHDGAKATWRQTVSERAKIAYHASAIPALVDINAHAGATYARGATPQSALAGAVASHAAERLVERFTKDKAATRPAAPTRSTPVTALAAARASAYHASTIVPKSAAIKPHTAPRGRPNISVGVRNQRR